MVPVYSEWLQMWTNGHQVQAEQAYKIVLVISS
jgi:hypothetical protein